jgi:hypothetical protein
MEEFYQKITKSRSRLNYVKAGLKTNLAHMEKCAPLLTEIMNSKRKNTSPQDTRPSFVNSITKTIFVLTEIDVNSSTRKKLGT